MGEKVLILGASRGQYGLYRACKRLGIEAIAASIPGNYPGFELADQICHVDITDPAAVVAVARELGVDGVATSCMDTGVDALGAVCDELGLPGLSVASATVCANKMMLKRRLVERGVPTARFVEAGDAEALDAALGDLGAPFVLKSRLSQGSAGVFITDDLAQARAWGLPVIEQEGSCIVEEYLDGYEFGAQACVANGEILFVLPHGDLTYQAQSPIPVGHYVPLDADGSIFEQAVDVSRQAIRALELDNCAVNIDIMCAGGKCYILELTGRAGANTLPEMVSAHFGIDYYEVVLMVALGRPIPAELFANPTSKTVLGKMMYLDHSATVARAGDEKIDNRISDARPFVEAGDEVPAFESLHDCVGQIVAVGDSLDDCAALIDRQFDSMFDFE